VSPNPPLLALVGPTASGKTEAACLIAERLGAEVVSVDSMLVYRGMDVGTAKPTPEQRERVPHHVIDLAEPEEPFSVARFQELAWEVIRGIRRRGGIPLLVGGGGLYFREVADRLDFPGTEPPIRELLQTEAGAVGPEGLYRRLSSLDPVAAGRIEPGNVRRTVRALEVAAITGRPFSSFAEAWQRFPSGAVRAAGIRIDRRVLRERIERRVQAMLPGLAAETEALLARGSRGFLTSSQAIGYAEMVACLEGRMTRSEAAAATVGRTNALARRQMAWLRRDPRIRWFDAGPEGAVGVAGALADYLAGGAGPAEDEDGNEPDGRGA
jgi:tRNA dimethylallyltransferase